jgi:adenylate cyclase
MAGLSFLYLAAAVHAFGAEAVWYPVVLPVLIQMPLAIAGSIAWKYVDLNRGQRNFRKALSYYLPADVADEIARDLKTLKVDNRVVNGVCLATDAEQYTKLAESMEPEALARHMNRYYETVFEPVKRHGGTVSNVVADSMLALWLATGKNPEPLKDACLAAIEISDAMQDFHGPLDGIRLHTRIGLHSGEIFLGNIGTSQHLEYRPMGDMVNTATRVEGLNKILGTRILVTREVLAPADMFLARDLGEFLLVGKSLPVHVFELVARRSEASALQLEYCDSFAEGRKAFRLQQWETADAKFRETLELRDGDGPSLFFRHLCLRYSQNPPGKEWDGVLHMETK